MATDRRILRIDVEAQAQQRIAAAVSGGLIVAAEGNLLWARDTLALYYIGALTSGSYPLSPINTAGVTDALTRAEAVSTALAPLTTGDGLIITQLLDGTLMVFNPASITASPGTVVIQGRTIHTITYTGGTP